MKQYIRLHVRHDLKLAYYDIPKAASTSIKKTLLGEKSPRGRGGKRKLTNAEKDYFTFCFVRHPVDRVMSAYSMLTNWSETSLRKQPHPIHPILSLSPYVEQVMAEGLIELQCQLVPFVDDRPDVDFIGRFENLQSDWNFLQQKFSLPDLMYVNRSRNLKNSKTAVDLSPHEIKALEDYYAKDMRVFEFASKLENQDD